MRTPRRRVVTVSEAVPGERATPPEMEGVRTLDTPALVSPDSRVPLRVWVPDDAAREAAPDAETLSYRRWTATGVLAARKARECGYRVREVLDFDPDGPDPDGVVVKLEVDADV